VAWLPSLPLLRRIHRAGWSPPTGTVAHSRAAPGARPPHGCHRVGAALWLAFGIAVAAVLALLSVPDIRRLPAAARRRPDLTLARTCHSRSPSCVKHVVRQRMHADREAGDGNGR